MENQKEFNEKLDKIRDNAIIEVSKWWGLGTPGYSGTLITKNKEVYLYQYYHIIPKELEDKNTNFILKNKELSINEYNKVINFIENELLNKEFHDETIFDAGYNVTVNYNGTKKRIRNNKGEGNNLKIYDKAQQLVDELLK